MRLTVKLSKYILFNIVRSRWLFVYSFIVLLISFVFSKFSPTHEKAILSITNISLIFVPLISAVFTTLYFYDSKGFYELLLSHNIPRKNIIIASLITVSLSMVLPFVVFISIPYIYFFGLDVVFILFVLGFSYISVFFTLLGFLVGVYVSDKLKGMGFVIVLWLFFSIIYDMLIFYFIITFSDYPIDKFVFAMVLLNPNTFLRNFILSNMGLKDVIVPFDINYSIAIPIYFLFIVFMVFIIIGRFRRMDF